MTETQERATAIGPGAGYERAGLLEAGSVQHERLDVDVRASAPDDAAALAAMLRGLSPTAGFQRFLAGLGEPKQFFVRALLATGPRRGAVLAVLPDDRVVGHACWSVDADGVADVGVLVTDAWQRRGLGRRLAEAAVGTAAGAGAERLHLDVHPANTHVVRMLRSRLPDARRVFADGLVQFDAPLSAVRPAFRPVRDRPASRQALASQP